MIRTSSKSIALCLASVGLAASATVVRAQGSNPLLPVPTASAGAGLGDLWRTSPGTGNGSPMAFGAAMGDVFVSGVWQNEIRGTKVAPATFTKNGFDDGSVSIGFGLGDAVEEIGLTTVFTMLSPFRPGERRKNAVSFHAFRNLNPTTVVAFGVENALVSGGEDGSRSYYGVASKVFQSPFTSVSWLKAVTMSVGVGNGRFRTINDFNADEKTANAFGSMAVLVHDQVSLLGDYTGQDLNFGLSIAPFRDRGFSINPMIVDVTQTATAKARFVLGVGYGVHF